MIAAGLAWACSAPALAGDGPPAPSVVSAMQAYVDPQTGEFTSDGRPLAMPSSQPLETVTEEPSPVAGKMVRLRGRGVSAVVARIAPDGSERVRCDAPRAPAASPVAR